MFSLQEEISNSGLPDCKAVVNLAGENIMNPFKRQGTNIIVFNVKNPNAKGAHTTIHTVTNTLKKSCRHSGEEHLIEYLTSNPIPSYTLHPSTLETEMQCQNNLVHLTDFLIFEYEYSMKWRDFTIEILALFRSS